VTTLGALLADVPHTRPVPMTGIGSDQELVERLGFERSTYEGPTGIVGVLHHACAKAGIPSASLWASVPHYVAAAPNPKAALALIRAFEGVARVAVDASDLEESAADYEQQVNAAVASDPEVKSFVERLEQTSSGSSASAGRTTRADRAPGVGVIPVHPTPLCEASSAGLSREERAESMPGADRRSFSPHVPRICCQRGSAAALALRGGYFSAAGHTIR